MNPSAEHCAFLAEIFKVPAAEEPLLIYADWLEERGDERSDYLRQQAEFRRNPMPAIRKKLIEAYPHQHVSWVARFEQAGVFNANLTDFEFAWWGTGIGPVRESHSTYERFRYEDQPPLPVEQFQGTFDWLKTEQEKESPQLARQWREFCEKTRASGYFVPEEFEFFMSSPDLPHRIKSCTDNFFIEPSAQECVETEAGIFVTFYADSQYCVIWGLLLPREPGRYAPVLAGPPESFFPEEYGMPEGEIEELPAPVLAASHLESFLYRWWIENEIWYATKWDETRRPLNSAEQAYLDHLSRVPPA